MRLRRNQKRRRGAALVELAYLLPFLLYLFVIGADWARLLYYTISCEACARAGALYAADIEASAVSPYANLQAAAQAEAPLLTTPPTITSNPTTINGRPGVQVTATLNFTTITNFPGVPSSQTLTRTVEMRVFPVTTN
jgi:Flp pilus assembly protein TadG